MCFLHLKGVIHTWFIIKLLEVSEIATIIHLYLEYFLHAAKHHLPRLQHRYVEMHCDVLAFFVRNSWRKSWNGDETALHFIFSCFLSSIIKVVFLPSGSVKPIDDVGLVLSCWLHPMLDYSLGSKSGHILQMSLTFYYAIKEVPFVNQDYSSCVYHSTNLTKQYQINSGGFHARTLVFHIYVAHSGRRLKAILNRTIQTSHSLQWRHQSMLLNDENVKTSSTAE